MNIQTVTHKGLSFLDIHNPHELEVKFLRNNYGFNPLNLEDFINRTQVPKIETYKEYTHVVLDFPYFKKNEEQKPNGNRSLLPQIPLPHFPDQQPKKRIITAHVAFFIGKEYLVVLHDDRTPQIDEIFLTCQKALRHREDLMGEGSVFLFYRVVDLLVDSSFALSNELSSTIDFIDGEIAQNRSPNIVEDISSTRRNLVVFQTMIKPILPIFSDLEKGVYKELNSGMTPFWSNILDHLQKIWEKLEDNRELIEGLSTSNESILSSRTNRIITILTIFSAILLPLNLIASVYGMNVAGLPFANAPTAFLTVLVLMGFVGGALLLIFKGSRWL